MRLPIDVTGTGPLYHSERLRHIAATTEDTEAAFVEQCADLLEQYRVALLDLYVLLLGTQTERKMSGTVLEQTAWIVAHRGLGIPTRAPYPAPHRPGISALD